MSGAHVKDAQDYIPFLKDQGIPNLIGASQRGLSMQSCQFVMVAGGVVDFGDNDLLDMETAGDYGVFIHNHTDAADEATCLNAVRLVNQLTITGPDNDDVLDVIVIGRLKGQLA